MGGSSHFFFIFTITCPNRCKYKNFIGWVGMGPKIFLGINGWHMLLLKKIMSFTILKGGKCEISYLFFLLTLQKAVFVLLEKNWIIIFTLCCNCLLLLYPIRYFNYMHAKYLSSFFFKGLYLTIITSINLLLHYL